MNKIQFRRIFIVLHLASFILLSSATLANGSYINYALNFNSSSDQVNIPDHSDINLGIHEQRTVEAWFKVEDKILTHKQTIYEEGGTTRGLNIYIGINGVLYCGAWNEANSQSDWDGHWIPWNNVQNNTWHHVAITLNGGPTIGPNAVKMYVDGQLISTGSGSQLWQHSGNIRIGKNGNTKYHDGDDNGGESFYGDIDEVRIWNVERTAYQINAAKDKILNGNETGLVAYYNFQENAGTIAYDSQTQGDNNGTIKNASWTSGPTIVSSIPYANSAPVATAQNVAGDEDMAQTINLTGTDLEGSPLTCALSAYPSNGNTSLSGNVITYTPNTNYNGTDSFTFTVNDGTEDSSPATVSITINPTNDIPLITSSPLLDALEGSLYDYAVSVNDIDGDAVAMTATTKPDWLTISNSNSNSLSFDGMNDYVEISNTSDLEPTSQVTVSTWAYMDNWSSASDSRIISNTQSGGFALALDVSWNQNKLGFYINIGGSYLHPDIDLSSLSSGWHHIVGTYDNRYAKLYIDGSLVDIVDNGSIVSISYGSDINLFIGAEPIDANNSTSLYFDGFINEVSIFETALNQSEIQSNINSGLTGNETSLVGFWNFNEGSGSIAYDQSSNGNDGTITSATWSNDVAYPSYVLNGTPGPSDGGLHNVVLTADDGNGGVITQSFTIAVSVTHLDIDGTSGFRILSSPISGAVYSDLLDELWTQGAVGSDHEGADPNIWTYNDGWNPVTNLNTDILAAGQSFVIYVFSDTDWDGDDDLPVTISVDGTPDQTGVTIATNPSKWNLIGNPYGLHVDVSQILSDNNTRLEQQTVYTLDHSNPGYSAHNGTIGDPQDGLIKPFDGFWIQTGANGDNFEFTEQSIRRGQITGNGRTTTDGSNGSAVFTFTNGEYTSSIYLSFTPEGDINLDPLDADRILPLSPAEHLTSMIYESGKSLSINNLPSNLSDDVSFDMDVMLLSPSDDGYETQADQVNLTWDITNLPEGMSLALINNGTGQTINLYGYPSVNVNLPSKGGFSSPEDFMATYPLVGEAQFMLSVFSDLTATEDEIVPENITLHNAYPNPFNPSTMISFDLIESDKVSLNIFDLAGRQVASLINKVMIPGTHQISWNPSQLSSGVYLVKLIVGNTSLNQKITYIK